MLAGFLDIFLLRFTQLMSKLTLTEKMKTKISKNPVNTKTSTCRSVFSNFEPILSPKFEIDISKKCENWWRKY